MSKAVYKFHKDCGRMGELDGLLIASTEEVRVLCEAGLDVYFGEVLGKHSEVTGVIKSNMFKLVSESHEVIEVIEKFDLQNGFDPFDYTLTSADREEFEDMEVREIVAILIKEGA